MWENETGTVFTSVEWLCVQHNTYDLYVKPCFESLRHSHPLVFSHCLLCLAAGSREHPASLTPWTAAPVGHQPGLLLLVASVLSSCCLSCWLCLGRAYWVYPNLLNFKFGGLKVVVFILPSQNSFRLRMQIGP